MVCFGLGIPASFKNTVDVGGKCIMTLKQKIIAITFAVSLLIAMLIPISFFDENLDIDFESMSKFAAKLIVFLILSTCALCWVGAMAGWRLGRENGLQELGCAILAFLGVYVSILVALYQLTPESQR